MFDIEDGTPPSLKDQARSLINSVLGAPPGGPRRFVRINAIATDRMEADLQAVVRPGLEGLILPKVDRADEVSLVDRLLTEQEALGGMEPGSVVLVPAIESAVGLLNAPAIAAAAARVIGLMFGAEDYGLDLGLSTNREGEARELIYARSAIVVAAAASHIQSVDGVWPDIQDFEGVRRDSIQARRLGFSGKSTFHPGQIDIINDVFSPGEAEVEHARRVVDAFEEAQAAGQAAVAFGGQLIDLPIVERARRVLRLHQTVGGRDES
jgi:citrate lyase subunit beta/citryl-CoA lyase